MDLFAPRPRLSIREWLPNWIDFVGSKVFRLMLASSLLGLGFSLIELAMAVSLQLFLAALGLFSAGSLQLPAVLRGLDLKATLVLLATVGTLRGLALFFQYHFQSAILNEFLEKQRARILRWAFLGRASNTAQTMSLFHDCSQAAGLYIRATEELVLQSAVGIVLVISLFSMSVNATLAALASAALLFFGLKGLDAKLSKEANRVSKEIRFINSSISDTIKNLILIQIYGTEHQELKRVSGSLHRYHSFERFNSKVAGVKTVLPQILGLGLICLISMVWKNAHPESSGAIISYFYLFIRLTQSISSASVAQSKLISCGARYRELRNWWDHASKEPTPSAPAVSTDTDLASEELWGWSLRDVTFRYTDESQAVVKCEQLDIAPGSFCVIMGPSGAGKSTLLGLLLGYLQASTGWVRLKVSSEKGGDLSDPSIKALLARKLGYVGPEPFVIDGTIYENLVYGLSHSPSEQDVRNAVDLAEAQFVWSLPGQLNYHLSEQGIGLSAGQKQRLALARALVRKPKVLILDEATSNLDLGTEARILDTLQKLKGRMTIVAVSHRETLERLADQKLHLSGTGVPERREHLNSPLA